MVEKGSQIALVTGASSGIGEATVKLMLEKGYRVIGTSRNPDRLDPLVRHAPDNFLGLELDVSDGDSAASLVRRIPSAWRAVDILVNNAGSDVGGRRNFQEGEIGDWINTLETNINGLIRVTYSLLPGMLQRNSGDIVNVGSTSGMEPVPTTAVYSASKHAVNGFSESLRKEVEETGVRVMQVLPGMVRTGFAAARYDDAEKGERFYDDFGKWMYPEDIANGIMFAIEQPRHVIVSQMVMVPKPI